MSELQNDARRNNLATILSLTAGFLIIFSGSLFSFWHTAFFPHVDTMMGSSEFAGSFFHAITLRLLLGSWVIIGSMLMYKRPHEIRKWGIMVLVLSAISFVGMGTFLIGAAFGIVGGSLAILKKQ